MTATTKRELEGEMLAPARNAARLHLHDQPPVQQFNTIAGKKLDLSELDLPVHIQFRRFAGCPICSIHLLEFARRRSEWTGSFHEIVLFHSSEDALAKHVGDLPLELVADPHQVIYRAFGVEASPHALYPRAWPAIVRSIGIVMLQVLSGARPLPPIAPKEGSLGLPADFLIGRDGRIEDLHYGEHAADQWSVDEVLRRTAQLRA